MASTAPAKCNNTAAPKAENTAPIKRLDSGAREHGVECTARDRQRSPSRPHSSPLPHPIVFSPTAFSLLPKRLQPVSMGRALTTKSMLRRLVNDETKRTEQKWKRGHGGAA